MHAIPIVQPRRFGLTIASVVAALAVLATHEAVPASDLRRPCARSTRAGARVLLVKHVMVPFKNILVATDCGPAAQRAAEIACGIAAGSGAPITLLHVWTVPLPSYAQGLTFPLEEMEAAGRQALDTEAARVREKCPGVEVKTMLLPGLAFRAVLEAIEEHRFDLVVMGTHGRKGLDHLFMGSVAEKVVRSAPVPVLTVRAPDEG